MMQSHSIVFLWKSECTFTSWMCSFLVCVRACACGHACVRVCGPTEMAERHDVQHILRMARELVLRVQSLMDK